MLISPFSYGFILHDLKKSVQLSVTYPREISEDKYYVVYEYIYKNTGIEVGNIAIDLINSLINKKTFDLDMRLKQLKEILMNEHIGLSTINICNEAKKRGIPILRKGDSSTFQLGYGKYSKLI